MRIGPDQSTTFRLGAAFAQVIPPDPIWPGSPRNIRPMSFHKIPKDDTQHQVHLDGAITLLGNDLQDEASRAGPRQSLPALD